MTTWKSPRRDARKASHPGRARRPPRGPVFKTVRHRTLTRHRLLQLRLDAYRGSRPRDNHILLPSLDLRATPTRNLPCAPTGPTPSTSTCVNPCRLVGDERQRWSGPGWFRNDTMARAAERIAIADVTLGPTAPTGRLRVRRVIRATTDMKPLSGTATRDEPRSSIIMKPSRRDGPGHGLVARASGKPAAPALYPDVLSTRGLAACLLPATWRMYFCAGYRRQGFQGFVEILSPRSWLDSGLV